MREGENMKKRKRGKRGQKRRTVKGRNKYIYTITGRSKCRRIAAGDRK
jgi:hypothetical protein